MSKTPISEAISRLRAKRNEHWDKGTLYRSQNRNLYANHQFDICNEIDCIISDLKMNSLDKEKELLLEMHLEGQEYKSEGSLPNIEEAYRCFNEKFTK